MPASPGPAALHHAVKTLRFAFLFYLRTWTLPQLFLQIIFFRTKLPSWCISPRGGSLPPAPALSAEEEEEEEEGKTRSWQLWLLISILPAWRWRMLLAGDAGSAFARDPCRGWDACRGLAAALAVPCRSRARLMPPCASVLGGGRDTSLCSFLLLTAGIRLSARCSRCWASLGSRSRGAATKSPSPPPLPVAPGMEGGPLSLGTCLVSSQLHHRRVWVFLGWSWVGVASQLSRHGTVRYQAAGFRLINEAPWIACSPRPTFCHFSRNLPFLPHFFRAEDVSATEAGVGGTGRDPGVPSPGGTRPGGMQAALRAGSCLPCHSSKTPARFPGNVLLPSETVRRREGGKGGEKGFLPDTSTGLCSGSDGNSGRQRGVGLGGGDRDRDGDWDATGMGMETGMGIGMRIGMRQAWEYNRDRDGDGHPIGMGTGTCPPGLQPGFCTPSQAQWDHLSGVLRELEQSWGAGGSREHPNALKQGWGPC